MEAEVTVSITEIDNGYIIHASTTGFMAAPFAANHAITGPKNDPKTAETLLQFVCEEILFKLLNRSATFGGELFSRAKVEVSFAEDPKNPLKRTDGESRYIKREGVMNV